jgi:hypothetical protein
LQDQRVPLTSLWEALPEATRQQTLLTLSQVVARQLATPRDPKEVSHEDR